MSEVEEKELKSYYGEDVDEIFENLEDKIKPGWKEFFKSCAEELEFIKEKLNKSINPGEGFLPQPKNVFRIFKNLDPDEIKVVIVGQDPYPQVVKHENDNKDKILVPRACGFSFSSPLSNIPVSLRNIFLELKRTNNNGDEDTRKNSGDLCHWVNQGVFLLNTYLTVLYDPVSNKGFPDSHSVWKCFTTKVLEYISVNTDAIFVLWGDKAYTSAKNVVSRKNIILQGSHPSADRFGKKKFLGCGHFSKINEILVERELKPIKWNPLKISIDRNYYVE